jgi:hypothetical protein
MNEPNVPRMTFYPQGGLPLSSPESERKVYDALVGALPPGWTGWHSLRLRNAAGEFAEADFVIADPARGILVLEVKGGIVRKQDGVWFQNERPMKMPPFDQAHRFVRILLGKYMERELVPPIIGLAAVFPDTEFEGQPTQGDLEGFVLGARELPYMEKLLPGLLERSLPVGMRRRPSPEWPAFLHALWCESWPAAMNLSCVVQGAGGQAHPTRRGAVRGARERHRERPRPRPRRGGHGQDAPRQGAG